MRLRPFRRLHFEKGKQLKGTFKAVLFVSFVSVFAARDSAAGATKLEAAAMPRREGVNSIVLSPSNAQ